MRDGFGPPRRRRRGAEFVVAVIIAVAVSIVIGLTAEPGDSGDDGFSWRGWRLDRRLPPVELPRTGAAESRPAAPADPPEGSSVVPRRPDHAVALTVMHVVDGDTIEAVPSGVDDAAAVRVRLIGVDTPETTPTPECWADEARAHLSELLPEGSTTWAASDAEPRDRHHRALFYLWTDDGRFVNHELVAAGDAEAIRVWPNVEHHDLLAATQAEAAASGSGRWGACG